MATRMPSRWVRLRSRDSEKVVAPKPGDSDLETTVENPVANDARSMVQAQRNRTREQGCRH